MPSMPVTVLNVCCQPGAAFWKTNLSGRKADKAELPKALRITAPSKRKLNGA